MHIFLYILLYSTVIYMSSINVTIPDVVRPGIEILAAYQKLTNEPVTLNIETNGDVIFNNVNYGAYSIDPVLFEQAHQRYIYIQ